MQQGLKRVHITKNRYINFLLSFSVKACSVYIVLHLNKCVFVYVYIYKFREFDNALNRAFTLINQASFKFQSSAFLEMADNSSFVWCFAVFAVRSLFVFFHTLLYTKNEIAVFEAVSFWCEGGLFEKNINSQLFRIDQSSCWNFAFIRTVWCFTKDSELWFLNSLQQVQSNFQCRKK